MITKSIFIVFIALLCVTNIYCQIENGWKMILIFQTNREQVESLFGNQISEDVLEVKYQKGNEYLAVKYSHNPCSNENPGRFNVPSNTVLGYEVSFKENIALSDITFDRNLYEKSKDTHKKISIIISILKTVFR